MVRVKQRYILFEILFPLEDDVVDVSDSIRSLHQGSPSAFNPKFLANSVRQSVADHYGDIGEGTAGMNIQVKYFSNRTSTGIIKVGRASFELVIAALALIDKLDSIPVIVRCVHVSGTIKRCQDWSMERNREMEKHLVSEKGGVLDKRLAGLV